jgi:hypothetical protein
MITVQGGRRGQPGYDGGRDAIQSGAKTAA